MHVPPLHYLHLRIRAPGDPDTWRVIKVTNQLALRELADVLQVAMGWSTAPGQLRIGRRVFAPEAQHVPVGRKLRPGVAVELVVEPGARRVDATVESWSGILPEEPRIRCLEAAGGLDASLIDSLLTAMWERPPRAEMN